MVGSALTSGKQKVGQIASIELLIPWELELSGSNDYLMPNTEFEGEADVNGASWDDGGDIWNGLALWRLVGMVDINVIAADDYTKTFSSTDVAGNDDMIIANTFNGYPLPANRFPLRLVGPSLSGSQKVAQIVKIELVNLPALMEEFTVENMSINFTNRLPRRDDIIIGGGSFALPGDADYDRFHHQYSIAAKWQVNRFLHKWLGYCLHQGHAFSPAREQLAEVLRSIEDEQALSLES